MQNGDQLGIIGSGCPSGGFSVVCPGDRGTPSKQAHQSPHLAKIWGRAGRVCLVYSSLHDLNFKDNPRGRMVLH